MDESELQMTLWRGNRAPLAGGLVIDKIWVTSEEQF